MALDWFRHVVWLMLENRSFDHALGGLHALIPELDGVPVSGTPRRNLDPEGRIYLQAPGAARTVEPEPRHETAHVLNQIDEHAGRFVKDFARAYPDSAQPQRQQVMSYHAPGALPALHALARTFAVCDHWHASVPGPTWTNRLFAMSGTSQGRVEMPAGLFQPNLHRYDQPSVFRRLEEKRKRARIYFGDFPLALLLADRRSVRGARSFSAFRHFARDAAGAEADFPELAFVEPSYLGDGADDDHPPHDVARGQALIARVYAALRKNPALFESTLLVVSYDEHGGFYDHVPPPPAVPPDAHREEYSFDLLGVRVPVVLASPLLERQVVAAPAVDHTALLRSLQLKWKLDAMGARVAAAPDVLGGLRIAAAPRGDVPAALLAEAAVPVDATVAVAARAHARRAAAAEPAPPPERLSRHEEAILAFSAWLDEQTKTRPKEKLAASARARRSPGSATKVAAQRAQRFLGERGARL